MRALISVYDKTGVVDVAAALSELGWDIVSSGGTAATLRDAGIAVIPVEDVTASPEMLDGRVKTLHPHIHGGILADRSKPAHLASLEEYGITAIDLVICNLYPFRSDPSVELIDIGGPTMVRAAAKNHAATTARVGLTNSDGCNETTPRLIHRWAPLISSPIQNVAKTQVKEMAITTSVTRKTPLGDSSETPRSTMSANGKNTNWRRTK